MHELTPVFLLFLWVVALLVVAAVRDRQDERRRLRAMLNRADGRVRRSRPLTDDEIATLLADGRSALWPHAKEVEF